MQRDILDWILEEKKDISGTGGEIEIKPAANRKEPVSVFSFDTRAAVM